MKYFFIVMLSVWGQVVLANDYNVAHINEALLKGAKMVTRLDETRIVIKSPGKAIYTRRYAYTILNEGAERYSYFVSYYDKFRDIKSISGTLYDAAGNKLKTVKKKDILDESGNIGTHLAIDARYKAHSFYYKAYPFTVEYEEEVEMDGLFYLPDWIPVSAPEVAVQSSDIQVIAPAAYNLRYKAFRYEGAPVVTTDRGNKIYQWSVKNIAAKKEEDAAPDWEDLTTKILIAPSDFEISGYKGNMDSWQQFGKFMATLYAGKDVLPETVRQQVQTIIAPLQSNREKIVALYKFMQDHTHYISIQLGIGGWQPLDAGYVAAKKYGDCKALSNYMCALLKEAGIKGYNVLIKAGEEESELVGDFPSNQFNHAVVCVPDKKDSIWLECTSQTAPAGYMGSFTGNRNALLVDGEHSKIVRTPVYAKQQNTQYRQIDAEISEEGRLTAGISTICAAIQQDGLHQVIHQYTPEEKLKRLRTAYNLPNYDVSKFDYQEKIKDGIPVVTEHIQLVSENYATVSGKRLFIAPNILATYIKKMTEEESRENDILYTYAFMDVDSVVISIPPGYTIEAMPKDIQLETDFGRYSISFAYKNSVLQMTRFYSRNAGRFPASKYKAYTGFYNAMYKADRSKVVLVKAAP